MKEDIGNPRSVVELFGRKDTHARFILKIKMESTIWFLIPVGNPRFEISRSSQNQSWSCTTESWSTVGQFPTDVEARLARNVQYSQNYFA